MYNRINLKNKKTISFNPSIDLALFASNLLEENLFPKNGMIYKYVTNLLTDKYGDSFYDNDFDFTFYIDSAKYSSKGIPHKQIEHKIFKEFTMNKRTFKKYQQKNNIKVYDLN